MECIKANVILDNKQTIMDVEMATIYAMTDININEVEYEVLKVLAVLKRSEVVKKVKNTPYYEKDYDISIRKRKIRKSFKRAVEDTKGEIVLCGSQLVELYYTLCCSGATSNSEDVIEKKVNYLRRIYCDKCSKNESYKRFHIKEYEEEIGKKFSYKDESTNVFSKVERDSEGRIKSLNFLGDDITGREFMRKLNIKSNKVYFKEETINLKVEGEGEGLGICIDGADALAKEGKSYKDIINYYYTGVDFKVLSNEGANTLKGKMFLLDPGHGGNDTGNVRDEMKESETTLSIAKNLKKLIEEKDGRVCLTREEDTLITLTDRAALANEMRPDFFISLHLNAFIMPGVNGSEAYCYENDSEAIELSEYILDELEKQVEVKKRKVTESDLFLLRESRVSSIVLECLYITGNKDSLLIKDDICEKIASAIFTGICNYFDIVA